jgi:transposase
VQQKCPHTQLLHYAANRQGQLSGLLLERGITLRKGRRHIRNALPAIMEDASAKLSGAPRKLLEELKLELDQVAERIDEADTVIERTAGNDESCRRLVAIPGIGPVTATALIVDLSSALPCSASLKPLLKGESFTDNPNRLRRA